MAYVGFYALGLFIGMVVSLGFGQSSDYLKTLAAILAAAFSGVALAFVNQLKDAIGKEQVKSVFMYPVGLFIAAMWYYVRSVMKLEIGWKIAAIIGMLLVSGLATLIALSPDLRAWLDRNQAPPEQQDMSWKKTG